MPSLFRRRQADVVTSEEPEEVPDDAASRPKSYTPSKKELGQATPKRVSSGRRPPSAAAPADRKEQTKQMRERQRQERAEATAGMRAGDERFLLARDRGPERRLVRNLVDSRRTVGTWFFGGALIVLIGSTVKISEIQLISNILWLVLALGVVGDAVFIARKVKRSVKEKFPKTDQRMGSLQLYGVMRSLTFRRMRVPKPQVNLGDKVL
ncbi:DUF3043 domain-containing protein [Actinoplanes sp. TBRC 11911]|uniref:DUF3043 domain-containing protein n=1 Tax=Actinoplanes sp. TBRC 11911 TaxID=2729386 RepID=UPI00145EAEDB|nr:DUF3043 domain-containing protein [Actinoplanes sp. TBRC 11911]NMO53064.1 DUF3043 domain-containing protein [Actinoplanes sp. TBRC 11911]